MADERRRRAEHGVDPHVKDAGRSADERAAPGEAVGQGSVEVVYATADVQRIVPLAHSPGMTATEAVRASGLLDSFPEIASRPLVLGVYGEPVDADRVLSPGDRVEICRPLLRDPRTLRRELLKQGQVMGKAGAE